MILTPNDDIIEAFIENRASSAEAEEVYRYLLANPDALERFRLMEDVSDQEISEGQYEIKADFIRKIFPSRKNWKLIPLSSAAAVFFVFAMFFWRTEPQLKTAYSSIKYSNNTQDTVTYYLPDHTQMMLLPGSQVNIDEDYAVKRRVNVIIGKVCFSVVKNRKNPFTVLANNISTTAVGTRFWISRIGESKVGISLLSGRVYINSEDELFKMDTVFLNIPSSCVVSKNENRVEFYNRETIASKEAKGEPRSVTPAASGKVGNIVWTSEKIVFSNVSVANMLEKLESRYKVVFQVRDTSINRSMVTGQIFYHDSLETLIKAICQVNKLNYQWQGDTIILRRQ
jgi:ferric-dicitrate binding protein FerR (iron transport regulator)